MKKQYNAIDILKLFFSICVVGIHTSIMQNENSNIEWGILHGIFRLAVPFFFVCSGFFLGAKLYKSTTIDEGLVEIKKYIKRLIIPFVCWMIIELPIQLYTYRKDSCTVILLKLIRKIIFYPWGALWYVLAVIVAIIIIIPFYKRNKIKNAMAIGGILYIFALICNNYYFLVENTVFQKVVDTYLKICISSRNGVFEGLYFVSSGIYISKLIKEGFNLNSLKNKIIFIVSYILLIMEIFLIKGQTYKDDHSLFIVFIILIPEMFIFFMNFNTKTDTKIIRNYSTGIYFMHAFVRDIIKAILLITNISMNRWLMFGSVITISIALLTILYKVNNKYINMIIK